MKYLEIFLQLAFVAVALGCCGALVFAVVADLSGWYDSSGRYRGPFSKRDR